MRSATARLPVAPKTRLRPVRARRRARTARDADAVRTEILDAAERIFAERGYGAATTREIALAARIGKRMLFYYFPTQEAMYQATLDRVVGRLAAIHRPVRNERGPVRRGDGDE